jgi:hypothetical protein
VSLPVKIMAVGIGGGGGRGIWTRGLASDPVEVTDAWFGLALLWRLVGEQVLLSGRALSGWQRGEVVSRRSFCPLHLVRSGAQSALQ